MENNKKKPAVNKTDYGKRLLNYLGGKGTWISARVLAESLGVARKSRPELLVALERAVRKGDVIEKRGQYHIKPRSSNTEATIVSVKEGFGFAHSEEYENDIFIPGRFLMGAMPGDLVLVRLSQERREGGSMEGQVSKIIEENDEPFTGVFRTFGSMYEIMPDSGSKISVKVSKMNTMGAQNGDKVLGRLIERGESHFTHKASVVQVFGSSQSAAACSAAILAGAGIERYFDYNVMHVAELIEKRGISAGEISGRLDLRDEIIFTIDGADTKDIDDAVSLEKTPYGWKLGVHIADVSYYVGQGSPIDVDAFARGTSVYYADSVVPMLPPELSNGICSLNEGEDRLAFSALMELDDEGKMTSYGFKKTVIRSRVKGVYSEINSILSGEADGEILKKYAGLTGTIAHMHTLASVLQGRRSAQGGVDLSSPEAKIVVDENGMASDIKMRVQGVSEGIIEQFMLTANEAAATLAMEHKLPFIYRVHDNPSPDKITNLCEMLDALGISCTDLKRQVSSAALAKVLNSVRGTDFELLVNNQILRSMAKAKYSEVNTGHFGLVMSNYAHFTSPIRRYPDLSIHRILSSFTEGMEDGDISDKYKTFVRKASAQATEREMISMRAERDCEDCYKAEYMRAHIGEDFDGIISSVTARGIYVRLQNTVEGMLRVDALPQGNYVYDGMVKLTEVVSGTTYRVGMPMRVRVAGADVSAGNIDFAVID